MASNSAGSYGGGGTRYGTLNNCTVVGNSAPKGGGVLDSDFYNSIIYYNTASSETNYGGSGVRNYSCIVPPPTNGFGNITVPPGFVNVAGDLHLQPDSPCINAGNNLYVTSSNDLDGGLRIYGGTVDMVAYEFRRPSQYSLTPGLNATDCPPTAWPTTPILTAMA